MIKHRTDEIHGLLDKVYKINLNFWYTLCFMFDALEETLKWNILMEWIQL